MSVWRIVEDWKWDRGEGVLRRRSVLEGPVDVGGLRIRRGTREEWKSVLGWVEHYSETQRLGTGKGVVSRLNGREFEHGYKWFDFQAGLLALDITVGGFSYLRASMVPSPDNSQFDFRSVAIPQNLFRRPEIISSAEVTDGTCVTEHQVGTIASMLGLGEYGLGLLKGWAYDNAMRVLGHADGEIRDAETGRVLNPPGHLEGFRHYAGSRLQDFSSYRSLSQEEQAAMLDFLFPVLAADFLAQEGMALRMVNKPSPERILEAGFVSGISRIMADYYLNANRQNYVEITPATPRYASVRIVDESGRPVTGLGRQDLAEFSYDGFVYRTALGDNSVNVVVLRPANSDVATIAVPRMVYAGTLASARDPDPRVWAMPALGIFDAMDLKGVKLA